MLPPPMCSASPAITTAKIHHGVPAGRWLMLSGIALCGSAVMGGPLLSGCLSGRFLLPPAGETHPDHPEYQQDQRHELRKEKVDRRDVYRWGQQPRQAVGEGRTGGH